MTYIVATFTFAVVRLLPGNPVDLYVQSLIAAGQTPEQALARVTALLGFDLSAPIGAQYVQFITNLAQGDLGSSAVLSPGTPVSELLWERVPWTLLSVGGALTVSFLIGLRLGTLAAYRRGRPVDHVITNTSAGVDAVPAVLLAVLAVLLLGVVWKVVPLDWMRGAYGSDVTPGWNLPFVVSVGQHLLVPGVVYILSSVGGWTLAMRSNAVSTLGSEYITAARARGLAERRIRNAYVQRNAQLPLVTGFAISLGFVLGGSVLIEQIFLYPGVGQLLGQAVTRLDYPVIQGVVIATTVAVLIMTAIADLLYGVLDPRTRARTAL
jgi:peptide/nickel transport system permease protein